MIRNSIPGYPAKLRIVGMPYRYVHKMMNGSCHFRLGWRGHQKIFDIIGKQIAAGGKVEFVHRRLDPPIQRAYSSEAVFETIDVILTP